ncbi:hypothetical protein E2C01_049107 [Portunus trituberculatus]|uniref:Uncharacterized protein n=1 Tax=Portunus trituberculatus TaxID=210409 RepID=A0A5B7GCA5_PORTR|nr:hypothetical protein [Portunus trituberculatus]
MCEIIQAMRQRRSGDATKCDTSPKSGESRTFHTCEASSIHGRTKCTGLADQKVRKTGGDDLERLTLQKVF